MKYFTQSTFVWLRSRSIAIVKHQSEKFIKRRDISFTKLIAPFTHFKKHNIGTKVKTRLYDMESDGAHISINLRFFLNAYNKILTRARCCYKIKITYLRVPLRWKSPSTPVCCSDVCELMMRCVQWHLFIATRRPEGDNDWMRNWWMRLIESDSWSVE